jgi:excisionase family DNA binding protein
VVTARKQIGASGPYRAALRNWQSPRSYEQLRPTTSAPPADDIEVLLRTTEVARRLQVSARTVLAWAQAGKLPSILTPGGHRRYPAQGVEQVLAAMTAAGEPRTVDELRR